MPICPRCNGQKGGKAFMCGPGSCGLAWADCSTCKGSGEVTDIGLLRIKQADKMAADRRQRRATLREEAARLGCGLGEWSRIEHGRKPETLAGALALAKRITELDGRMVD